MNKNRSLDLFSVVKKEYPAIPCFDFTRSMEFIISHQDSIDIKNAVYPFRSFAFGGKFAVNAQKVMECLNADDPLRPSLDFIKEFAMVRGFEIAACVIDAFIPDPELDVFCQRSGEVLIRFRMCMSALFADIELTPDYPPSAFSPSEKNRWFREREIQDRKNTVRAYLHHLMAVAILGFAAANQIKNVDFKEVTPALGRVERRRGDIGVRYKVLDVGLLGSLKKTTSYGPYEPDAHILPLHLVRAHVRHYVDKPLFGKYFGSFLIPAHMRGSAESGIVDKDYKFRPPVQ